MPLNALAAELGTTLLEVIPACLVLSSMMDALSVNWEVAQVATRRVTWQVPLNAQCATQLCQDASLAHPIQCAPFVRLDTITLEQLERVPALFVQHNARYVHQIRCVQVALSVIS